MSNAMEEELALSARVLTEPDKGLNEAHRVLRANIVVQRSGNSRVCERSWPVMCVMVGF
jgi:hypothetical protein